MHVAYDPATRERMRGRRVDVIVAHELHADLEPLECRIVKRRDPEPAVGAIHERVAAAVVGLRRRHALEAGGHTDEHVARAGAERVPDVAAPLRPPRVLELRVHLACDELGDAILEPLLPLVGEREVVRVGADPKGAGIGMRDAGRERA